MNLNRYDDSWKDIWREAHLAPKEEKWKWDPYTWDAILEKIWGGDTHHLVCPICNQGDVYFKYLAVHEIKVDGKRQLHGERWVGCDSCNIQIHDRARLPDWLKNPEWAPGLGPDRSE